MPNLYLSIKDFRSLIFRVVLNSICGNLKRLKEYFPNSQSKMDQSLEKNRKDKEEEKETGSTLLKIANRRRGREEWKGWQGNEKEERRAK